MTKRAKEEDRQEPQLESEPQKEDDPQHEEEPDHPGWQLLANFLDTTNALFDNCSFLLGYELSSNIYVIAGDYLTLVDPGNDYTAFTELFKGGVNPTDIKKVILTHGHRDHAMGLFELLRYPSVMENKDLEIILHEGGPQEFKEMIKQVGFTFTELKGGETLELSGFEWQVVHTPGHTIDGICLYHAPTKTAFTGDTVMPHAMGDVDKAAGGDLGHYLYALKALLRMDIENILPGHGFPLASFGEKVVEETYEGVMMNIAGFKEEPGPWIEMAKSLAQKGLLEESVFCCEKELASNPKDSMALQLKGMCLNDLGRCADAIAVFDRVLAEKSDNVFALTGKGSALLGLQRYDESIEYFDKSLEIDPNMKDAMVFKGMALYLTGRYDEAMEIETFRREFVQKFKKEVNKGPQPGDQN